MIESQILVWFFVGCAVIVLVSRLASVAKRHAIQEQGLEASLASCITVQDSRDFEGKCEELMTMVARSLGVRREKLTSDARFQDDLRVPPGELNTLLDELQERYGIVINPKNIRSVGDILDLIRVKNE